jgi:hypothetical protein
MALCNFVLYRYHMDYHMIEPGPARWKSGIWPSEMWHRSFPYV